MPAQSHQQHGRHIMVFEQPSGADYNLRKSSDLQTTHLYVVCYVEVSNGQVLARSRKKHLHSRWQIRLKFTIGYTQVNEHGNKNCTSKGQTLTANFTLMGHLAPASHGRFGGSAPVTSHATMMLFFDKKKLQPWGFAWIWGKHEIRLFHDLKWLPSG